MLSRLSDFHSSYYYLKKSLEISNNNRPIELPGIINTYLSLAFNAGNLRDFPKSINYIDIALMKLNTGELKQKYQRIHVNLLVIKTRTLIKSHKFNLAKKNYDKILGYYEKLERHQKIYLSELEVRFLLNEKNSSKSEIIDHLHNLLKNSIDIRDRELKTRTLYMLKDYHFKIKDLKAAYKYANKILKEKESNKQVDLMINHSFRKPAEESEDGEFEIYHKKDLETAADYQASFFKEKIKSKHFNLNTLFSPSKTLSGDYLGTFNVSNQDNNYLFVLADVVGKGITASYISFMIDGIIKSIIINTDSFNLRNIIKDINTILSDALDGQGFVSLWAGILNTNNSTLESVNAGHLPTFLLKEDKTIIELSEGSTILGMFKDLPDFKTETIEYSKGDSIIAYSDGVTEAINSKHEFYEEKFHSLIKNYANQKDFNFIKLLEAEVKLFQDKSQIQDDVSCLLIDFKN